MLSYPTPVSILIADDHRLITEGISKLLENERMTGIVHTANDGIEAVDKALKLDIDCVIMDVNMPGMNGIEATRRIKQVKPFVKIIVVSMLSDASVVSKMLKAGADGFINKDSGKDELLRALEKVLLGEKYISPEISNELLFHNAERTNQPTEGDIHLTPRELEITGHIVNGLTNKEIAARLFLSPVTVETHRKNILAKLRLKNTASLVKYAMDNRLF